MSDPTVVIHQGFSAGIAEPIQPRYWLVTFAPDGGKGIPLNEVLDEHPIQFLMRPRSIPYVLIFATPITEAQFKQWEEG